MNPYYDIIEYILPFEGPHNSTMFQNYASNMRQITRSGNAVISTTKSKWGKGACYLDGSDDCLYMDPVSMTASDFTIGMHICPDSPSASIAAIFSQDYGSAKTPYLLALLKSSTQYILRYYSANTTEWDVVAGLSLGGPYNYGEWHYIEVSRSGQTYYGRVDGVNIDTKVATLNPASSTSKFVLGADRVYTGTEYKGYIQDFVLRPYARNNLMVPGRLIEYEFPDYDSETLVIGGRLTVDGNDPGNYTAIIGATTKELVVLVEPDINGYWESSVPFGLYYLEFFADGYQAQISGPHTVSSGGVSPAIPDIVLGSSSGTTKTVGYAF